MGRFACDWHRLRNFRFRNHRPAHDIEHSNDLQTTTLVRVLQCDGAAIEFRFDAGAITESGHTYDSLLPGASVMRIEGTDISVASVTDLYEIRRALLRRDVSGIAPSETATFVRYEQHFMGLQDLMEALEWEAAESERLAVDVAPRTPLSTATKSRAELLQ